MSTKNRIRNIDEIVTQNGTVIDLENIQASGGSTATVNASGLAISRSEDSQYIDYAFNEGAANPHGADGHRDGVSIWMHVGVMAANSGDYRWSQQYQFSDPQTHDTGWVQLSEGRTMGAAVSDADKVLQVGGSIHNGNDTYVGTGEMINFSAATKSSAGSLNVNRSYNVGLGDGASGWVGTGITSAGSLVGDVAKYNMSDGSVSNGVATASAYHVRTASSNGTTGYFFGN